MELDYSVVSSSWQFLLTGMQYTLELTAISTFGGLALGTLIALARLSSIRWLSALAAGYVNFMRALPLVLILFWFFFLMPEVARLLFNLDRPPMIGANRTAIITFIIFEAAYFAEIMRAGIQSIPKGQASAAFALGLSYWQSMACIILPQAFRNMLPVLLTQTIILFQDTSLVYVISGTDFMGAASKIAQRDGALIEMYTFAALVYLIISLTLSSFVKRIQRKMTIR